MSLEALERSDLSRLPGGIFTRAFIRAYAQEVGLDPDRTIQDFIAELPPEAATATAHSTAVEDGEKLESDRKAVATAVAPGADQSSDHRSRRVLRLAQRSACRTAFIRLVRSLSAAGSRSRHHRWIRFQRHRNQPLRRPLRPQTSGDFDGARADGRVLGVGHGRRASGVRAIDERRRQTSRARPRSRSPLSVGDAGAFVYTLNGRAGKPLGAAGKSVRTRITLANLPEFQTP